MPIFRHPPRQGTALRCWSLGREVFFSTPTTPFQKKNTVELDILRSPAQVYKLCTTLGFGLNFYLVKKQQLFMVLRIFPFSEDTLVRETGTSPCTMELAKHHEQEHFAPENLVQRTCLSQWGSLIGITPSYISILLVFPKHSKSLAIDQARFCLSCPQQTWRAIGYQLISAHSDARALQC